VVQQAEKRLLPWLVYQPRCVGVSVCCLSSPALLTGGTLLDVVLLLLQWLRPTWAVCVQLCTKSQRDVLLVLQVLQVLLAMCYSLSLPLW
jgi:hypothetical protein